jgi:hypothetical protein
MGSELNLQNPEFRGLAMVGEFAACESFVLPIDVTSLHAWMQTPGR